MVSPDLDQVLDRGHSHGVNSVWGERTGHLSAHSQPILKDIEDFTYQVSVRARGNADNHTYTHTPESNAGENKCSIFHHMVRTEYVRWWMIVESVCVSWTLSSGTSQHERKEPFSTWQTSDKAVFHTCPTWRHALPLCWYLCVNTVTHKWTCHLYYICLSSLFCHISPSENFYFDVICNLRELGVFDNSGNKNIHFKHHMLSFLPGQVFIIPLSRMLDKHSETVQRSRTLHHYKYIYISHIYMCVFTHT